MKNYNKGDNNKRNSLFSCIKNNRNVFDIDPYGGMSFCPYLRNSKFRYKLSIKNFKKSWNYFWEKLKGRILKMLKVKDILYVLNVRRN